MMTELARPGDPIDKYLVSSFGGAAYCPLTDPFTKGETLPGENEKVAAPLTKGERLCQEDAKASCCTKDEGGPFGAAL